MNIKTEITTTPWAHIEAVGPMFRPPEAAKYLGIGLSTYYEWAQAGTLPKFSKLSFSGRASAVPKCHLDAAIAVKFAQHTQKSANGTK